MTPSFECTKGQGESGKTIKTTQACDQAKCEKECENDKQCIGFDLTSKFCNKYTCRLYPLNTPRTDGGRDERIYCKKLGKTRNLNFPKVQFYLVHKFNTIC